MFLGSFIDKQKDVPDQYQWRGEEYLSWSSEGVSSDQQMTKRQVDQVLRESYHDVLGAFLSDEVMVGQLQWIEWKVLKVNINCGPTQELKKQTNTLKLVPTQF